MTSWQDEHMIAGMRDFAAGTLSGVAGVIAGHPLDTIRVRMQLSKVGSSVSTKDVWKNMVSNEGVRLFFLSAFNCTYFPPPPPQLCIHLELHHLQSYLHSHWRSSKEWLHPWQGLVC
jgi:hypothetical protein